MRTGGKSGELVEFINRIKNIKSKNFDKTNFTQKKDQYVMFLGIALFLFCLGFVLDLGRFVKRGKLSWITNIFLFTLLFLPSNLQGQTPQVQAMSPQQADASSDVVPERKSTRHAGRNKNGAWKGNRSFEKNDFPKALSAYASAVYAFSGNQLAKLYLNLANTFVKNQDPQNAGKYYEMALNTASDKELKSRILYQTGLLSFKNRQYTQAAAFFKESLKLNENNDDARYNYAVSVLFAENSQDENQSEDKQDEQEQQNDENKQENENEKKEQEQQQQEKKAENMKDMLEALENKERENSRQNAEAKQSQNQQQQWRGKYW